MQEQADLIKHFEKFGKTDSWLKLAIQFNILPNAINKQRSDKVRKIYNSWFKREGYKYALPGIGGSVVKVTLSKDWQVQSVFPEVQQSKKVRDSYNTLEEELEEFFRLKRQQMKSKDGIHIIIGCVHVPFHNKELLKGLLNFISDYKDKIKGFHIIGDFLDMGSLNSHNSDSIELSGLTLGKEYKEGNKVLDLIQERLPTDCQLSYIYGNHEDRYFRTISNVKNYRFADAIISPHDGLKLNGRGFNVYTNWKEDYVQVGKYQVFHGIFCTQTPAKSHITKLKESCIFAHTHRVDSYYEKDLHGLNIGSLADLNSSAFNYVSRIERMNWKNAFSIVHVNGENSQADVIMCDNNTFYYGGKRY